MDLQEDIKVKEDLIKKIEKMMEEEEKLIISLKFFVYGIVFSLVASITSFYIYDFGKDLNLYPEFAFISVILTISFGFLIYLDFKRRIEKFNSLKWKHYLYTQKIKREENKKNFNNKR